MTIQESRRRSKQKIKDRIAKSNQDVKNGLSPDPWVIEFRNKNNKIKAIWKAKQPKKLRTPRHKKAKTPEEINLEKIKKRVASREYRLKNPDKIKKLYLKYRDRDNLLRRERRLKNPGFRIACNLRKRLSFLLKAHAAGKTKQTLSLLGCSMEYFMLHLESRFTPGMSFDNYGDWHIDHIKPCDSFDLTNIDEQAKCFHYSNMQPLWAKDNRRKSNKYEA